MNRNLRPKDVAEANRTAIRCRNSKTSGWSRALGAFAISVALLLGGVGGAAQPTSARRAMQGPLKLESTGSFFVGGRTVSQTGTEAGLYGAGPFLIDQMYVQYMVPVAKSGRSIVMIHGATLTGKSFETTPDGRMGWNEYFVRRGFASYVVDQVGRGRSGFDQAPFNRVRAGVALPGTQPLLRRVANSIAWLRFRIGPEAGLPYKDTQFPIEAANDFGKQAVPDLTQSFPRDDPNYSALSELSKKLRGAILMGHSQAGRYPFETALINPSGIKALIAIEPPGCKAAEYTDEEMARLTKLPILVVFGDHLDTPQTFGPSWKPFFNDCEGFVARINSMGGRATMLYPPKLGIYGNSHMLMMDKNNLLIADMIIKWIGDTVR